jgi:patatin-related protein
MVGKGDDGAGGAAAGEGAGRISARGRRLPRLRELPRTRGAAPGAAAALAAPAALPGDVAPRLSAGNESVVELRLALVCYGGVSLAIYMHGITKELEKLVVASRGFEASPGANPFDAGCVEHHYWQALKKIADDSGISKRVIVDIVAGTSAGGINGVFLAKALAGNLSQDPLTDLWFTKGDIWKLLGGGKLHDSIHLAAFLMQLPLGHASPPLDGDAMYRWLVEALEAMEKAPQAVPAGHPLAPAGQPLQLFVTTTDYYGYPQKLLLSDPPVVTERWNRDVMEFAHPVAAGAHDPFGPGGNAALAFAARATSSFPGAFPPFSLPAVDRNLEILGRPAQAEAMGKNLFRRYDLAGADPARTFFVDGGVLDNYPFQPTVDAIVRRTAAAEVDRRLIFIDPAPAGAAGEAPGTVPSFFGTVWAGLSSLPSAQPIVDQLLVVRQFNERVKFVNGIVAGTSGDVEQRLMEIMREGGLTRLEALDLTSLGDWIQEIEDEAAKQAGYLYESYFQIRVASVIAQFSAAICLRCDYPADTNTAYLVQLVVEEWARQGKLLPAKDAPADRRRQQALLERFDLGYTRRRLGFVIQKLNSLYAELDGAFAHPTRAEINEAKAELYETIQRLNGFIGGDIDPRVASGIDELFTGSPFPMPSFDQPVDTLAVDFTKAHAARLDEIGDGLGDFLAAQRQALLGDLLGKFNRFTAAWDAAVRRDLLVRFLGFPFWDALIYPTTKLSQAGELRELDVVRFSPDDAKTLEAGGAAAKLEGLKVHHFGAFFSREARENDYLWGRLDAADRIFHLLFQVPPVSELAGALGAILAEEKGNLLTVQKKIVDLTSRVERLRAAER